MGELDATLFRFFYGANAGSLTGLALLLSALGSGWVMIGLIPFLASARWRRPATTLILAIAGSAAVVAFTKAVVGRTRPCVTLLGVHALCAAPTDPSFPSGHACGSFTAAAFILVVMHTDTDDRVGAPLRTVITLALVSLATAIAWSRVYLGVHFPGDVLAGALLGASFGAAFGWLYRHVVGRQPLKLV